MSQILQNINFEKTMVIGGILKNISLNNKNPNLKGDMNYLSKLFEYFGFQLKGSPFEN